MLASFKLREKASVPSAHLLFHISHELITYHINVCSVCDLLFSYAFFADCSSGDKSSVMQQLLC